MSCRCQLKCLWEISTVNFHGFFDAFTAGGTFLKLRLLSQIYGLIIEIGFRKYVEIKRSQTKLVH